MPGERVRAVVAGEDDHGRGGTVDVQGSRVAVGVGKREVERHTAQRTLPPWRSSRAALTVALAARQGLLERWTLPPAEAVRRLTPLQGQFAPAPFIALAARLEGFTKADLEQAIDARTVVKTTIMRQTLHLAAAEDFRPTPSSHGGVGCGCGGARPHLDEERHPRARRLVPEPRTNTEIREHVCRYEGVPTDRYTPILWRAPCCRSFNCHPRGTSGHRARSAFVLDPRPLVADAAAVVLTAIWRRSARRRSATSPRGRGSRRATSRGTGSRPSPTATRRAASCSISPVVRSRPPTRRSRRAFSPTGTSRCWPTPIGTGSSRPRSSRCS